MITESKAGMLRANVEANLPVETVAMTIDMSAPIQTLFDDFVTFISKTDFD